MWPTYFVQAMKYFMTWHIAEPVTDQPTKAQYFQTLAVGSLAENGRGGALRTAMNIDGHSQPSALIEDWPLLSVRAS